MMAVCCIHKQKQTLRVEVEDPSVLLEQTSILLCCDSQLLRVLVGFMQSLNSDSSQRAAQQGVMH